MTEKTRSHPGDPGHCSPSARSASRGDSSFLSLGGIGVPDGVANCATESASTTLARFRIGNIGHVAISHANATPPASTSRHHPLIEFGRGHRSRVRVSFYPSFALHVA